MSVPRVLIVDDDLALLQALPEALRLRMEEATRRLPLSSGSPQSIMTR